MTPIGSFFLVAQAGSKQVSAWVRDWGLPFKLATAASILVVGGMVHLGLLVSGHIRESAVRQAASAPALYIGSFVEPYVQELATKESLSNESLDALDRLLSPGAMQRPVVSFRVWKGDTIVFSNERQLIGKRYAISPSRALAWQGQIAVEFDNPDGDDDEQVRSLNVPVLEVYAPLRKTGTDRIVALVETYEIAIDIKSKLLANELAMWIAFGAAALGIILFLFSTAQTGSIERHWLLNRIVESEQRRQRVSRANLEVSEMSERSLAQIETALHRGPAQYVTLALLKLGPMANLVSKIDGHHPNDKAEYEKDIEEIRQALNTTLHQIRSFASHRIPSNIGDLSLANVIASACRRHELRSGIPVEFENAGLPDQVAFSLKACFHRIALEGLSCASGDVRAQALVVRGSSDGDHVILEITGSGSEECAEIAALRSRVEAAGGILRVLSLSGGRLSLTTEFTISDMEQVNA